MTSTGFLRSGKACFTISFVVHLTLGAKSAAYAAKASGINGNTCMSLTPLKRAVPLVKYGVEVSPATITPPSMPIANVRSIANSANFTGFFILPAAILIYCCVTTASTGNIIAAAMDAS